jgi:hypothetical protein
MQADLKHKIDAGSGLLSDLILSETVPSVVLLLEEEDADAVSQESEYLIRFKVRTLKPAFLCLEGYRLCYLLVHLFTILTFQRIQHPILFSHHVIEVHCLPGSLIKT